MCLTSSELVCVCVCMCVCACVCVCEGTCQHGHPINPNPQIRVWIGTSQLSQNTGISPATHTIAHIITNTRPCTAEDREYAREKYSKQGFDYEAAQSPEAQKKVCRRGLRGRCLRLGLGIGFGSKDVCTPPCVVACGC